MIITIKTIQLDVFFIEASDDITVLQLKHKIFEVKGEDFAVPRQILIYSGSLLSDERTLTSYRYREDKYVIVMINRSIATNVEDNHVSSVDSKSSDEEKHLDLAIGRDLNAAMASSLNRTSGEAFSPLNCICGEASSSLNCASGEASSLLKCASGEASSLNCASGEASSSLNRTSGKAYSSLNRTSGEASSSLNRTFGESSLARDFVEFLRNNSQFRYIRELIRANPHILGAFLMHLSYTNRSLFHKIINNSDEFIDILGTPIEITMERMRKEEFEQLVVGKNNSIICGDDGGCNNERSGAMTVNKVLKDENTVGSHVVDPNSVDPNKLVDDRTKVVATSSDEINGDQDKIVAKSGDRAKIGDDGDRAKPDDSQTELSGGGGAAAAAVGMELEAGCAEFDARVGNVNVAAANTMNANQLASADRETGTIIQLNSSHYSFVITDADRLAIRRLTTLGFDEITVLQAYVACDKNEEFAANFLLNDSD